MDWTAPIVVSPQHTAVSAVARLLVAMWFIPRAQEPRVRRRLRVREIVYRIARYTPITEVALDWLTITRRRRGDE